MTSADFALCRLREKIITKEIINAIREMITTKCKAHDFVNHAKTQRLITKIHHVQKLLLLNHTVAMKPCIRSAEEIFRLCTRDRLLKEFFTISVIILIEHNARWVSTAASIEKL